MTGSAEAPKRKPRRTAANDKFHNYKVCASCGDEKRLADFALTGEWRKKRAADPLRYRKHCKECTRAPSAAHTDPNFVTHRVRRPRRVAPTLEERRSSNAAYKRRTRRAARIKALEYLASKGCAECGERDPRVLEFDHLDPRRKKHDVSRILADGYSWGSEKLREEIRKCRVICANCHRLHTITQQEYYAHDDVRTALRAIYDDYDIVE